MNTAHRPSYSLQDLGFAHRRSSLDGVSGRPIKCHQGSKTNKSEFSFLEKLMFSWFRKDFCRYAFDPGYGRRRCSEIFHTVETGPNHLPVRANVWATKQSSIFLPVWWENDEIWNCVWMKEEILGPHSRVSSHIQEIPPTRRTLACYNSCSANYGGTVNEGIIVSPVRPFQKCFYKPRSIFTSKSFAET